MQNIVKKLALWLLVSCCVFSMLACKNNTTDGYNSSPPIDSDIASSIDNDSIPPIVCTQHSFQEQIIMKPTCTELGSKIYTCENCGIYYMEDIPSLGHKYSSKITKEPTKTEKGIETYTCIHNCGSSYTKDIPKLEPNIYVKSLGEGGSVYALSEDGGKAFVQLIFFDVPSYVEDFWSSLEYYEISSDWSTVKLHVVIRDSSDSMYWKNSEGYTAKYILQLCCGGELICEQECYTPKIQSKYYDHEFDVLFELTEPIEYGKWYTIKIAV